jgi:tetratricopeptide (TPR) repeat protein
MSEKPPPLPKKSRKIGLIIAIAILAMVVAGGVLFWRIGVLLKGPTSRLISTSQATRLIVEGDRLNKKGDHAGAARKYRAAVRQTPKVYVNHWLNAQWKLAEALKPLKQYDEMADIYREMLPVYAKHFGETHEHTIKCSRWLGYVLVKLRHYDEAEVVLRQTLSASEKANSVKPAGLVHDLVGLADLLQRTNRLKEGISHARRALDILEKNPPANTEDHAKSLNVLGCLLRDDGQPDEAELTFRRALAIQESDSNIGSIHLAYTRWTLGMLCNSQGKHDEAVELVMNAVTIMEKELGPQDRDTVRARRDLNSLSRSRVGR